MPPLVPGTSTPPPPTALQSSALMAEQKKAATPPLKDLSSIFQQMSLLNPYADLDWDKELVVNLDQGWKNCNLLLFQTLSVLIGNEPMTSTDMGTVLRHMDKHWFSEGLDNFEPFAATQISLNEIVVEYPWQSFDFLCGPVPTSNGDYPSDKMDHVFCTSVMPQEQIEYEIV